MIARAMRSRAVRSSLIAARWPPRWTTSAHARLNAWLKRRVSFGPKGSPGLLDRRREDGLRIENTPMILWSALAD
jgi:hypothetical protein